MAGWLRILRRDGSVLRAQGLSSVAELIVDGLVAGDDRVGDRAAAEITAMRWAFAVGGDCDSPYESYELSMEAD